MFPDIFLNMFQSPECSALTFSPPTSPWTSSFFSYPGSSIQETDLFGFQDNEEQLFLSHDYLEPSHLYLEDNFYDPNLQMLLDESAMKTESEDFQSQDLSAVSSFEKPPVIISENDNCCVVLESSGMSNDVKEYFSLWKLTQKQRMKTIFPVLK